MAGNPNGTVTQSGHDQCRHGFGTDTPPCAWCGTKEVTGDDSVDFGSDQCRHEANQARARGWYPWRGEVEGKGAVNLLAAFWEQRIDCLKRHRREELQFLLSDQFVAWCDLDGHGRIGDRRARFLQLWEVRFGDEGLLQRTPCRTCGTTNVGDFWQSGEDWIDERPYCKACELAQKQKARERR